jgi:hypothetical protein
LHRSNLGGLIGYGADLADLIRQVGVMSAAFPFQHRAWVDRLARLSACGLRSHFRDLPIIRRAKVISAAPNQPQR